MARHDRGKFVLVLYACPMVALLLWHFHSTDGPARLLLNCYVIVATPLYVLTGSYPPFGTRWFWKAMLPIAALAAICVYLQVQLADWFRYIEVTLPARMAFGLTAAFAILEAWAALRIVDATEPPKHSRMAP